ILAEPVDGGAEKTEKTVIFDETAGAAVRSFAIIGGGPYPIVHERTFAQEAITLRPGEPCLISILAAFFFSGEPLPEEKRPGFRGCPELFDDRSCQPGKLAVNVGAARMGEDRVDSAVGVGVKAFNLGALGNEGIQAAIAAVDGVCLEEGFLVCEGAVVLDP